MKPNRLIYLPLEPYQERYTSQLSASKVGWFEANWIKAGVNYIRIDGWDNNAEWKEDGNTKRLTIKTGSVLDAVGRSRWCANQMLRLYDMIDKGELKPTDAIYFDDFWHPGVESLRYIFDQQEGKQRPKMYTFCWAQSADIYDFTFRMERWIRHYEKGNGRVFDEVFVANSLLAQMLVQTKIVPHFGKVRVVGLPFDSSQVLSMMGDKPLQKKKRQVVFSSRWTWEKRPELFIKAIQSYVSMYPNDEEIKFIFCSSSDKKPEWHYSAVKYLGEEPRIEVRYGLSKQEYYDLLCESSIQINTSLQDWVSYTLLEAVCANCQLIYPNERSFPETFSAMADFMGAVPCLNVNNPRQVAERIHDLLEIKPSETSSLINRELWEVKRKLIIDTHDQTWKRILYHMDMLPFVLHNCFDPHRVYPSQ